MLRKGLAKTLTDVSGALRRGKEQSAHGHLRVLSGGARGPAEQDPKDHENWGAKNTFTGTVMEDAHILKEKAQKVASTVSETVKSMWGEGKRSAKENFGEAASRTGPQAFSETVTQLKDDAKEQFSEAAKRHEIVPGLEDLKEAKEAAKEDMRQLGRDTKEYLEQVQKRSDQRIVPGPDPGEGGVGRF